MFSKNKNIFLFIPVIFLNIIFVLGFFLIYIKTVSTSENIYFELLNSSDFFASLIYGLYISFLTIFLSCSLFLSIYYLLFLLKFKYTQDLNIWFLFLSIPILIPYSFCAFLMFLMFFPVGFFKDIMPFLVGTSYSIVIAYIYKIVPFLLLVTFPNLLKISKNEINLHKVYSSKSFHFFWYILIKRNFKVMFISLFVVFSYVFNAYEIPSILGSNIEKMPAIYVSELLGQYGINSTNYAYGSSLLYFLTTICFVPIFFLCYKIANKVLF